MKLKMLEVTIYNDGRYVKCTSYDNLGLVPLQILTLQVQRYVTGTGPHQSMICLFRPTIISRLFRPIILSN